MRLVIHNRLIFLLADSGFYYTFRIKVPCRLQFLGYLRKFKISEGYKQNCPVGCLHLAETANRAETGQIEFLSYPSEILNFKSSNTNETLDQSQL